MSRVSLARTQILAVAGALVLGACGSSPETPGGTGGTSPAGTGGTSPAGTGGTSPAGTGGSTPTCGAGRADDGRARLRRADAGGHGDVDGEIFRRRCDPRRRQLSIHHELVGKGWTAANVSYSGTSFTIASATGTSMPDGTPIGYPTTYCGRYSENAAGGNCGLPAAFSTIDKLWTGWKWSATDRGQYNAAWDIWLGTASTFQSYLMVWLRDPPGRQPAGSTTINNVTVAGVPGTWKIYYGTVNSRPIVNYLRTEGQDACEFEFNVMDFVNDAQARSATTPALMLPATPCAPWRSDSSSGPGPSRASGRRTSTSS